MARHKDAQWSVGDEVQTWDEVHTVLLMDIRDELKRLNELLWCSRFINIPNTLDKIATNTTRPKKKRRAPRS